MNTIINNHRWLGLHEKDSSILIIWFSGLSVAFYLKPVKFNYFAIIGRLCQGQAVAKSAVLNKT